MPSRRIDIPAARRELTNQIRELDATLFAVSGASDTDVVKLKRCEAMQRDERKKDPKARVAAQRAGAAAGDSASG